MTPAQISINCLAREIIPLRDGEAWFTSQDAAERHQILRDLLCCVLQAHPLPEEVETAIQRSRVKASMTPCVVLMKWRAQPSAGVKKVAGLPESEHLKAFKLLLALFTVADERRRHTQCRDGCTHDWHDVPLLFKLSPKAANAGAPPKPDMMTEVQRFLDWASTNPYAYKADWWEHEYDHWPALYAAVHEFCWTRPFDTWNADEVKAVLYAIARDEEWQRLSKDLRQLYPVHLIQIARASVAIGEERSRYQLARQLGYLGLAAEEALLMLARDEAEYVRVRALAALLDIGSPALEETAITEWRRTDKEENWAGPMALRCLVKMGSPRLEELLVEAKGSDDPGIRGMAEYVRQGGNLD